MAMRSLSPFRWGRRNVPAGTELSPFDAFQQEMNRLFDDFFKGFGLRSYSEAGGALTAFTPQIDMTEDEKSVKVSAELPGLSDKDIDINLSRDSLTIKGQKKEEKEEKGEQTYYAERSFGSFTRVIPLPVEVNPDKAEASFSNGVLTINMPKVHEEKKEQKKIEIKSS
ncbi:MAG TPA: Hsp20/alpha crystallin family protein [Deltaproteobacteria bacterium]|jgi:HSP20 family protein|nr:Hsp20/alpha crystallin family protein [Deltaproteobacteria bacterium]HQI00023.1 Hsp20/alpha crystallin family protein [Deltaproteobacteria bacterium]HQJ08719.1 Hsp20/alpha crystallin family protein [Deltaproteobacteria bacterium]